MNKDAIEREIFDAAAKYAAKNKVKFGDGADRDIRVFAKRAASEIAILPIGEQLGRIMAASLSFERLIDEMIRQSRSIPNYQAQHPGIIGEQTLAGALSLLCPLWPFC